MGVIYDLIKFIDVTDSQLDEYDVISVLSKINKHTLTPEDLKYAEYEWIAFHMQERFNWGKFNGKIWGEHFGPIYVNENGETWPNKSMITEELFCYWVSRIEQCSHPVLKVRYAGLALDFRSMLKNKINIDVLRKIIIENCLLISRKHLLGNEYQILDKLKWALEIALLERNSDLISEVKNEILNRAEIISDIYLIEMILRKVRKELTSAEEARLINDLERHINCGGFITAENAAKILANYYGSKKSKIAAKNTIEMYINNILTSASIEQPLRWQHILGEALKIGKNYGIGNCLITKIEAKFREMSKYLWKDMTVIQSQMTVDFSKIDCFIDFVLSDKSVSVIDALAANFIIKIQDVESLLDQKKKDNPITYSASRTLLGHNNITAVVMDNETDDLVNELKQLIKNDAIFLRRFIEKGVSSRKINIKTIKKRISNSTIFPITHSQQLFRGLNAYLKNDFITAIYLLIPQLENAIRKLLLENGSVGLAINKSGGFDEQPLGTLLSDEVLQKILGKDCTMYFKTLYTHKAGISLRNLISHGNASDSVFTIEHADFVFHTFLILVALPRSNIEK